MEGKTDGEIPEEKLEEPGERREENEGLKGVVFVNTREKEPREFYISKEDGEKYGYTRGCGGCSSWFKGLGRQPHTEACRERFKELMKGAAKVKNAEKRKKEFEERVTKRKKEEKPEGVEVEVNPQGGRIQKGGASGSGVKRGGGDLEELELEAQEEDEGMKIGEVECWGEFVEEAKKEKKLRWADEEEDEKVVEINQVEMREELEEELKRIDEEREEHGCEQWAWDDVNQKHLDAGKVRKARKEEVEYMKGRKIWRVRPKEECRRRTGKEPIGVRWVDTEKGDGSVRCRLVARDFKGKEVGEREDLFAATPPLEGLRLLISSAATRRRKRREGRRGVRKMMFIDAKKAHLNPRCKEVIYVDLPEEAGEGKEMCGVLDFWLYGCRGAAQAWEDLYAERLVSVGFVRGKRSPVVFYHPGRDVKCVVHGDDFTLEGEGEDLEWIRKEMESWFEIKVRAVLGPEEKDDKETVILGRRVVWKEWGIEYEADPGQREKILEFFGFEFGKTRELSTNGSKKEGEFGDEESEVLDKGVGSNYRSVGARFNYLQQDCPDLQYGTKEVCRGMANPTERDWECLKKLARYLVGRERVVWRYEWQEEGAKWRVNTDSDWAGCKATRKSCSGGVLMKGTHCIKTWCSTQGAIALSSAEAEFYSMVEGVLRGYEMVGLRQRVGRGGVCDECDFGNGFECGEGVCEQEGSWQDETHAGEVVVVAGGGEERECESF